MWRRRVSMITLYLGTLGDWAMGSSLASSCLLLIAMKQLVILLQLCDFIVILQSKIIATKNMGLC